jgi:uncharacterized protein YdhG (YjbR/CyaY superfamily)
MAADKSERTSYFPAIEKKYGQPMSYWFSQMQEMSEAKYPEQIAFLKEEHGFSQAHANALVMYCRGSVTTRRFNTLDDYLKTADALTANTVREIFAAIKKKYPKLELVIAWNQPMLKFGDEYVFGLSTHSKHILLGPWGNDAISRLGTKLDGYKVNKKTVQVPSDWKINGTLLAAMVKLRLDELKS